MLGFTGLQGSRLFGGCIGKLRALEVISFEDVKRS